MGWSARASRSGFWCCFFWLPERLPFMRGRYPRPSDLSADSVERPVSELNLASERPVFADDNVILPGETFALAILPVLDIVGAKSPAPAP